MMDFMDGVILLLIAAVAIGFGLLWWKNKKEKKVPADPIAPTLGTLAGTYPNITLGEQAKQIPVRIFPDNIYTSIEALLLDLRALHFRHKTIVDGHMVWPIGEDGLGPPITYATVGGSIVQVNGAFTVTTPPVTPPPPPPVPVPPTPPVPAQTLQEYALTHGFPVAALGELLAFAATHPGLSHEQTIAAFYSYQANPPVTAPAPPTEPAPQYVDTRNWNHNNWLWFIEHPEMWSRVENTLYNNQMKNAHSQGGALNTGGLPVRPDNL